MNEIFQIISPQTTRGDGYYDCVAPKVSSENNDFIPTICATTGELITSRGSKKFIYSIDFPLGHSVDNTTRISKLCESLFSDRLRWLKYRHRLIPETTSYYSFRGIVVRRDGLEFKVLMCLCFKKSELFNVTPNLKEHQLTLVVDNSFINDEENFKVYRNVKRTYIDVVSQQIDVVYTNDINKLCFAEKYDIPKFKTVSGMLAYNQELTDTVLQEIKSLQ